MVSYYSTMDFHYTTRSQGPAPFSAFLINKERLDSDRTMFFIENESLPGGMIENIIMPDFINSIQRPINIGFTWWRDAVREA
jgi:hypothetical protein